MRARVSFWVAPAAASVLWLGSAGCGPKCEPIYIGDATDEAWRTMIDAYDSAEIGTAAAPVVIAPAEGGVLAPAAPGDAPRIRWECTAICLGPGPAPARAATAASAAAPRTMGKTVCGAERSGARGAGAAARSRDVLAAIHSWLVPDVQAHLPPVTGPIFYLEVPVGADCSVLWLTTDSWVDVDEVTLERLRSGPDVLSLTITGAYLTENRVTEGPYRPAAPTTFTVE